MGGNFGVLGLVVACGVGFFGLLPVWRVPVCVFMVLGFS
jgi:hypothetical protein